jgi:hypothetical protein
MVILPMTITHVYVFASERLTDLKKIMTLPNTGKDAGVQ